LNQVQSGSSRGPSGNKTENLCLRKWFRLGQLRTQNEHKSAGCPAPLHRDLVVLHDGYSTAEITLTQSTVMRGQLCGGFPRRKRIQNHCQIYELYLQPDDGPPAVEAPHASLGTCKRQRTVTRSDCRCHLDSRKAPGSGRPSDSCSREAREQNMEDRVARSVVREMGIRGE